jgi:hypothetical protein
LAGSRRSRSGARSHMRAEHDPGGSRGMIPGTFPEAICVQGGMWRIVR